MKKFLKTVLLILNIIAVLLFIGATMAGTVQPSKFIGLSLLSYLYLYLLAVNVIFVIIWLLFSSKWFLLSLASIIVRVGFVPLYIQVGGTDHIDDGKIPATQLLKVMSFNVHQFWGEDFDSKMNDSNMLKFVDIVTSEKPDVMVMQEYIGRGEKYHLTEQLGNMGYIHQTSGYGNGSMTGNVIFSKLPIVNTECIDGHSKLYADLLWNDDTVRIFCLHLSSYQLDKSDRQQIHDISHGNVDSTMGRSTLKKFRNTILAHEQEWTTLETYFDGCNKTSVVAGDMNDTPSSFFYQQCRKLFNDSFCEAGQGFSSTYHGPFSFNAKWPAMRIDMVLHSPDIEAVAYHRIKSDLSDHYPVIVTLRKK